MNNWVWIILALVVIVAGASWQAFALASRMKTRGRKSLRARRADKWRARSEYADHQSRSGGERSDAGAPDRVSEGAPDGGDGGGDGD